MPVVDLQGGVVPKPEGDNPKAGQVREPRDPVEEIEQAVYRGERLKAFKQAAGVHEPDRQENQHAIVPVQTPDYTPVLKAFADSMSAAITAVGGIYTKMTPQQAANSDSGIWNKFLIDEFKDMRAKLNQPGPDPLSLLLETDERLSGLMDRWKQREGVPKNVPVGLGNMDAMIRLEELKGEREERNQKWQSEVEERREERQEANRRWNSEFQLRILELKDNRDSRHRATDMLDDLMGALGDGMAMGGAGEGDIATSVEKPPTSQRRIPKSFRCGKCQEVVKVPSPDTTTLECPNCHTEYDLTQPGG